MQTIASTSLHCKVADLLQIDPTGLYNHEMMDLHQFLEDPTIDQGNPELDEEELAELAAVADQISDEELFQLAEAIKCRKSWRYFVDNYVYIRTNEGGLEKMVPYPWQYLVIHELVHRRNVVVLKSRQVGLSWTAAIYGLWLGLFHDRQQIYFFSINGDKAISQLNRVKIILDGLPVWMKAGVTSLQKSVNFAYTRSYIVSSTAGPNAGRGESANFVFCDEMAFWQFDDYMWTGIYPTLSSGGSVGLIGSTPPEPERGDCRYLRLLEDVNQGIANKDSIWSKWRSIVIHYSQCRGRDENWVLREKAGLNEREWQREFELIIGEVGYPFFAIDKIRYDPTAQPKALFPIFYNGIDSSELKKGKDQSAIVSLSEDGVQVDQYYSSVERPPTMGEWAEDGGIVSQWIQNHPGITIVENNAVGNVTVMRAKEYHNGQDQLVFAWYTGQASRVKMLNDLALDLETGGIIVTDLYTYNCLKNFVQTEKGKPMAAFGWKDDAVIAIALANQARRRGMNVTVAVGTTKTVGQMREHISLSEPDKTVRPQQQVSHRNIPIFGGETRWTKELK